MVIEYENLAQLNAPYEQQFKEKFASISSSGRYMFGPENDAFENEFAAYCGANYCRGVGSGTDALILALQALKLSPGAEVVVASNAYIACIMAIISAGLTPVLAEPDPDTYLLTALGIQTALTTRTKAVLVVHLYGRAAVMDEIVDLARNKALAVIEDCAQAHGAAWMDQKVGTWGDVAAFSFFPTKNLGALGDGGAIVTNNKAIAEQVSQLRFYGFGEKNISHSFGRVSRLDEIQAGILRLKLASLDDLNNHKNRLAKIYDEGLPEWIKLPAHVDETKVTCVFHVYPILSDRRDALKVHLENEGIQTLIHYPVPPARQPSLSNWFDQEAFPLADRLAQQELSLPISGIHNANDIQRVCAAFSSF